ncbi:MAG TPA: hypothetical protein VK206_26920, partial [Anaerolineales bacterium]|nr:hypothetical protein [Anaerolineales bacterium]
MADVYFQWQNEVLLKTIYPLRNMKLRDFLVYYREIELWAEYKDRSHDSLLNEINDYIKSQTQTMQEMKDSFFCLKEYFENEIEENQSTDCLKKYFGSELDAKSMAERSPAAADEYAKIKSLHHTCKTYLPNYHNVRKEKIFIAQRVNEWEEHQKELFRKAQRVQPVAGQKNPYEDALNMAKVELDYLHQFISFYNKIDTRRVELIKPRGEKISRKETIESILNPLKLQIRNRQAQIAELEDTLQRIQARPSLAVVKQHFSMGTILSRFGQVFKDQEVSFFNKFSGIWKLVNLIVTKTQGLDVMLLSIKTEIGEMQRLKEDVERRIADLEASLAKMAVDDPRRGTTESAIGKLRDLDLNGVMAELDKLRDGRVALEFIVNRSDQEIAEILRGKEQELLKQKEDLVSPAAQANELQRELDSIEEFLNQSSDDNLLNFISGNTLEPDHVSVRDIVNAQLEAYSKELASKDHFGLLEEVVQRFLASPEDYPLWLQYMVIHFSGMRYASAHGSWADPKDLLINLGSSYIADDFKEEDDDWVQARCDEKIECYGDPGKALSEPGRLLPKLVQQIASEAKTPETKSNWTDKITFHLQGLKSAFAYQRRKALVDILIDEATYAVETLTPDETLETVKDVKDFLPLPEWMWREIVKLTELRTSEVTSEDWERPITLTPQEEIDPDLSQYQAMMNQWKQANLTSWREAHEDTDRLIVTRAVCN